MARDFLFTSEAVTIGHPDKLADGISDAILDAMIAQDPTARVAVETLAYSGGFVIAGEVTTSCYVDVDQVTRQVLVKAGYTAEFGLDPAAVGILVHIHEQSPDIAQGVDALEPGRIGAGDQGMMFGFAIDETPELMPLGYMLARELCLRLAYVREHKIIKGLGPDGKAQVTIQYLDGKPSHVHTVLVSSQHSPGWNLDDLREAIIADVIRVVIPEKMLCAATRHLVNPTGRFVIGGPPGDTGLTGRKIMVDTYGGMARHGGGAFSGKDPTKVDRSGAYAARWVAKNIVAAGLAKKCEVQVAYAIGVPEPISVHVETFGTGSVASVADERIAKVVSEEFDLRPGIIIKQLDLRRPIYYSLAVGGHFGRPPVELRWERTDRVDDLKRLVV